MPNTLKEELSKLEEEQVRSNIERIISSYRHVWDIYTELLQNSADAILEEFGEDNCDRGFIKLEIDTLEREISITDNGIGIKEDEMSKILVTGKSLKRERKKGKFGFMGYGFTFVAFQSEYLRIKSIKDGEKAIRTYKNLYQFVYSTSEIPNSEEEMNGYTSEICNEPNGTKITLKFPKEFPNECVEQAIAATFRIADQENLIKAVLRTRSVVGLLDKVFGSGKSFSFELYVADKLIEVPTGYLTTREIVKDVLKSENLIYSRDKYEPIINATDILPRNPKDQARKAILLEEKINDIKIGERNPLTARFYIAATSKSHINSYNEHLKYSDANDENTDYKIEHGLWLAICGMPTGICLDAFEHSNYLPYTVIVDIQDKSLRNDLDAGRKGISDYRKKQIVNKAFEILKNNNFIKYRRYVVGGGDTRISDPLYDPKQELLEKMEDKEFIECELNFRYFPPIEEQEVIILFTELISRSILKGYNLKVVSGYQVYDGLYEYYLKLDDHTIYSEDNPLGIHKNIFTRYSGTLKKDSILVEFKRELKGIYNDIHNNKKDVSHIDLLICWSTNYDERDKFSREYGDILQERDMTTNVFYGVTHQLIGAGRQQPLPIIELKTILEKVLKINF